VGDAHRFEVMMRGAAVLLPDLSCASVADPYYASSRIPSMNLQEREQIRFSQLLSLIGLDI
jgi:hypothetical protein